jgi:hypothetical protein
VLTYQLTGNVWLYAIMFVYFSYIVPLKCFFLCQNGIYCATVFTERFLFEASVPRSLSIDTPKFKKYYLIKQEHTTQDFLKDHPFPRVVLKIRINTGNNINSKTSCICFLQETDTVPG